MIIYLLLLLLLVGISYFYLGHPLADLYHLDQPVDWGCTVEVELGIGALLGLIVVGLSRFISKHYIWAKRIDQDFGALFAEHSSVHLTALALLSSFAEELFFRGVLIDVMGLIWSAILFGILHIPIERHHWPWTVAAILMGFVFGYVTVLTGSITIAFIAHFTVNHFNLHALKASNFERKSTV